MKRLDYAGRSSEQIELLEAARDILVLGISEKTIARVTNAVDLLTIAGEVDRHKVANHQIFHRVRFNEIYGGVTKYKVVFPNHQSPISKYAL